MKKILVTIWLILLTASSALSQSDSSETAIANSNYVFEGIVIDMDFIKDTNEVYFVSYSIQVQKVLKGNSKMNTLDTVELISPMPRGWAILPSGELIGSAAPDHLPLSKQKGFKMSLKANGVFMVKANQSKISQNISNRVSFEPYCIASDCFYYIRPSETINTETHKVLPGFTITGFGKTFNSKEDFNTYLQTQKALPLVGETIKKKDATTEEQEEKNKLQYAQRVQNAFNYQNQLNEKINNITNQSATKAVEDITFEILNEEVTGIGTQYYEFDIYASGSSSNTYLDNAAFSLAFNTFAFGINLSANDKVTITRAPTYNIATYEDPDASVFDDAPNEIRFHLGTDFNAGIWSRPQMIVTPQPLMHFKLEILDCIGFTNIEFVDISEVSNVAIYTENATESPIGTIFVYDNVNYTQPSPFQLCPPPSINSFSPMVISTGTESILIISGEGFGIERGIGQVQFPEANDGGATMIPYMNALDYVSWNDTEIQIRLPFFVDSMNVLSFPGSGDFIVKRNDGLTTISNSPLLINYAVFNAFLGTLGTPSYRKVPYRHIDNSVFFDGYAKEFYLDTSITNNPPMEAFIRRSLRDWSCATSINWVIAGIVTQQGLVLDNKSIIYLDDSFHGSPLARTESTNGLVCLDATTNKEYTYWKETDIALSRDFVGVNSDWFFDTTMTLPIPLNKWDFYSTIAHELGHAHYLGHVNNLDDILYYGEDAGPTAAANRYRLYSSQGSMDGGTDMMNQSIQINTSNCTEVGRVTRLFPTNCGDLSVSENELPKIFKVYPNPFDETVSLDFDLIGKSFVSYAVYDIFGKIISAEDLGSLTKGHYNEKINLGSVASGVYLITIQFGDKSETIHLIKQ